MLGKSIRANSSIKGITVNNTEIKISQNAGDTTLILNGERESLSAALNTVDNFGYASGLKLNDKKTEDFCFLLARHYIWGFRTSNKTLHSQYKIETFKQVYHVKDMGSFCPTPQR